MTPCKKCELSIEDYRYEEVPVPEPGPGEVLVKVEAVGICAGDAKTYDGATRFWGEYYRLYTCHGHVATCHCQVTGRVSRATWSLQSLPVMSSQDVWSNWVSNNFVVRDYSINTWW